MDALIDAMGEPDSKFAFNVVLNSYPTLFYLNICYFSDVPVMNDNNQVGEHNQILHSLLAGEFFCFCFLTLFYIFSTDATTVGSRKGRGP